MGEAALKGVSLGVKFGEVVGLIGESGCGKSTLTLTALGLLDFDSGDVEILGDRIEDLSKAKLIERRKRFQILFQDPDATLNPSLTVRQHLIESAALHQSGEPQGVVVREAAESVSLSHRLDALPRELSGGEKRRVGLARVMIAKPVLLVADEPTAGLDAGLKADLIDLVIKRQSGDRHSPDTGSAPNQRSAVLLVSHDLPLVTYACDRVVVMYNGKVVERFQVSQMQEQRHHPYTRRLLHAAGMGQEASSGVQFPKVSPPSDEGCAWANSCELAKKQCFDGTPKLAKIASQQEVACFLMEGS
jgi:oligopeptide/dipeptide ABC transporter ATP-binding protein